MTVKSVLFYRNFTSFQGGHLKVFDYINHVNSIDGYQPLLYVSPGSHEHELWSTSPFLVRQYRPDEADILFLAGNDWQNLSVYPGIEYEKPIINLIQGFRHFLTDNILYQYLSRKAIRICVSNELTAELINCNICHDPIFTIPNGIDHSILPSPSFCDPAKVLIIGLKQPKLADELSDRLRLCNISVECTSSLLPRSVLLHKMNRADIVVTLPFPVEGFYLPALEAMAMGKALVCPDCIGNRSFCQHEINCLMPAFQLDSIEAAVLRLLSAPDLTRKLKERAFFDSQAYNTERERTQFSQILLSCDV